jgi:hypothetical protein
MIHIYLQFPEKFKDIFKYSEKVIFKYKTGVFPMVTWEDAATWAVWMIVCGSMSVGLALGSY